MATQRGSYGDGAGDIAPGVAHTTGTDEKHGLGHASSHSNSGSESPKGVNEKENGDYGMSAPAYDEEGAGESGQLRVENAEQLVTNVLSVDDDPTLNPWTFRMWFIGEC